MLRLVFVCNASTARKKKKKMTLNFFFFQKISTPTCVAVIDTIQGSFRDADLVSSVGFPGRSVCETQDILANRERTLGARDQTAG